MSDFVRMLVFCVKMAKYLESSLAPDVWHSVSLSIVEPDGSFYCHRQDDVVRLDGLMLELASMQLVPVSGAVVDGMACVVRSTDNRIYRAHVSILGILSSFYGDVIV